MRGVRQRQSPDDAEEERQRARQWWRRLPLDLRATAAADLSQHEIPWASWFFNRPNGPYLDELHRMASLFEAGEPEAMELEPWPLHPPAYGGTPLRSASEPLEPFEPQATLPW